MMVGELAEMSARSKADYLAEKWVAQKVGWLEYVKV